MLNLTKKFSIIIPVYNDPQGIKDTAEACLNQNISDDEYEIIIVDNNSTDQTSSIIEQLQRKNKNLYKFSEKDVQSSYAARNKGIKESTGEIKVFIDSDMIPEKEMLQKLKTKNFLYAGMNIKVGRDIKSLLGLYDSFTSLPVKHLLEDSDFAPTAGLAVHEEIFDSYGLFDDRLFSGGDMEFGQRVQDVEKDYFEEIQLYHPVRNKIGQLFKRYHRIGRGHADLEYYHLNRFSGYYGPWNLKDIFDKWKKLSFMLKIKLKLVNTLVLMSVMSGYYREKTTNIIFGEQRWI